MQKLHSNFSKKKKTQVNDRVVILAYQHTDDKGDGDPDANFKDVFELGLRCLVIDGHHFCKHSELLYVWMSIHRSTSLKQLTIAQHKPGKNHGYSPKDIFNGVDAINFLKVEQLKLESLKFASCPLDISPSFSSRFLHLEDLSDAFIADIPKLAYSSVLCITYCQLPSLHHFDNVPDTLILEDINSNVNLLGAVTIWKGEISDLTTAIRFQICFSKRCAVVESHIGYPCNEMHRLLLYRLSTFSVVLLKILIKKE